MPKIKSIASWICKTLTKKEVKKLVLKLKEMLKDKDTSFKKATKKLPNYRKFKVDPRKPIKILFRRAKRKNYKKIIKSNNYQPPIILNDLKNTHLLQDKWAKIIQSNIA